MSTTFQKLTIDEMYAASGRRDTRYDGVFFMAVRTTGIFCRPGCPARTPRKENVQFFANARDALAAGFRACKKCRPLESAGATPIWLDALIRKIDEQPARKWREDDLRNAGVQPRRVSRWFQKHHGITFHTWLRSRRLSWALERLVEGNDVLQVALDCGFESASGFRSAFRNTFGITPGQVRSNNHARLDSNLLLISRILSPLGPLLVVASRVSVYMLEFADRPILRDQIQRIAQRTGYLIRPGGNDLTVETARQLNEYFLGQRREFDVPLAPQGTSFQRQVWQQLQQLRYGETSSYSQIARRLGQPGSQRAVGRANGLNPLAIVIPCHRVIRADGSLSGYGGGLRRKQWLLDLEQAPDMDDAN